MAKSRNSIKGLGGFNIPTLPQVLNEGGRLINLIDKSSYSFISVNKTETLVFDSASAVQLVMSDGIFDIGDEIEIYNKNSTICSLKVIDTSVASIFYKGIDNNGDNANIITIPLYSKCWLKCTDTNIYELVIQYLQDIQNVLDQTPRTWTKTEGDYTYTFSVFEYSNQFGVSVQNNITGDSQDFFLGENKFDSILTADSGQKQVNVDWNVLEGFYALTQDGTFGTNKFNVAPRTSGTSETVTISTPKNLPTGDYITVLQPDTQRSTSTSGTQSASNTNNEIIFIHEAGVTATLTYEFPPNPIDKQKVTVMSTGGIATLTLTAAIGTIVNAITTLSSGSSATYMYLESQTKWYKIG